MTSATWCNALANEKANKCHSRRQLEPPIPFSRRGLSQNHLQSMVIGESGNESGANKITNKETNKQTNKRNKQTNERTNERTNEQIETKLSTCLHLSLQEPTLMQYFLNENPFIPCNPNT